MDHLNKIIAEKKVDLKNGLSSNEVLIRLKNYGYNEIEKKKKQSFFITLINQFNDPTIYLLLVAVALSFFLKEYVDVAIILIVLLVNAIVGSFQEFKAEKALEELKRLSSLHANVIRDGKIVKEEPCNLVIGDIVYLQEGDIVPADLFLYEVNSLMIDESLLNGESLPLEKKFVDQDYSKLAISSRINEAFMSTRVIKGNAKGIVINVGMNTELGKIAQSIQTIKQKTPLQIRLTKLSNLLGVLTIIIFLLVMVFAIFQHYNLVEFLIFAISLGVAAIPEGLPAVVTIVLSLGVIKLAKVNAIVRKLPSVETLGSVDVICSDKTGTLTENKLRVEKIFYNNEYRKDIKGTLLEISFVLNNNATNSIGDPLEVALNNYVSNYEKIKNNYPRIKEIPFSSDTKMMKVECKYQNKNITISKGAFENIIRECNYIELNNQIIKLDSYFKKLLIKEKENMEKESLKVIAFSYSFNEKEMIFLSLVGFFDAPRKGVEKSVDILKKAGITTLMITGDSLDTSFEIAKKVGICTQKEQCIDLSTCKDIDIDDDKIKDYRVFSRVNPIHKLKIVEYYQKRNHIVAMTGDGVNDSPALKKADVGISMGSGSDVSKESSDIILQDDNFKTIEKAIEEGRNVFVNIKKSILFLLSSNLGEVIAILFFVLLDLPTPLIAIHILWVNLISDSLPALALGSDKKYNDIMSDKPRKKGESLFEKNGLFITIFYGILISLVTIVGFLYHPISELIKFNIDINLNNLRVILQNQDLLNKSRTLAFCILSISEIFHMVGMSNIKLSLFKIIKNHNILRSFAFILGLFLQLSVVEFSFMRSIFSTTTLMMNDWILIICLSCTPLLFHELLVKFFHTNL